MQLMVHMKAQLHLRLKFKAALSVTIELYLKMHSGALVSAKEFTKQFNER